MDVNLTFKELSARLDAQHAEMKRLELSRLLGAKISAGIRRKYTKRQITERMSKMGIRSRQLHKNTMHGKPRKCTCDQVDVCMRCRTYHKYRQQYLAKKQVSANTPIINA